MSPRVEPAASPPGDDRPPGDRPPGDDRPRVTIANRADGGVAYWIGKLYGFAALVLARRRDARGVRDLRLLLARRAAGGTPRASPPHTRTRSPRTCPAVSRDVRRRRHAARRVREGVARARAVRADPRSSWSTRSSPSRITTSSTHRGLYFKGIARAVWANITARRLRAGRLDDHAAGRQAVPRRARSRCRARARKRSWRAGSRRRTRSSAILVGLPQPHLPRRRRVGRRRGGAALLPEAARPAHARRVRADRGAREGADGVLADRTGPKLAIERRNVVLDKMATLRLRDRGRGRRGEAGADHARPLPRRVPRPDAVLRRARPPLRHRTPSTATTRCSSGGLRDRDRRRADVGSRRVRERRLRRAPPGQAPGLARPRVAASTVPRARCSSRGSSSSTAAAPLAPRQALPRARRQGDGRRRRAADRRSPAQAAAAQHAVGVEVGARQRRERLADRQRARRRSSPATWCG